MSIATVFILSVIILYIAKEKNLFSLPFKTFKPVNATWLLLINFVSFILLLISIPPLLHAYLKDSKYLSLFFSTASLLILLPLNLYCFATFKGVLKQISFPGKKPLSYDLILGLVFFAIAIFPYLFINTTFAAITEHLFGKIKESQTAVSLLRQTPINLITVIFLAPVLEEFFFRGLLQNSLGQKFCAKTTIHISSILFAFFHFNTSQGILNITLIPSLYVFALFLGFVYEKTRSLISPIILHSTFNLISAIHILYLN